ncbi:filamentous hemagglutinin family N-terminal domain containing protein [Polaromonas sp. CF318]|uniref:two-partner secretion domain-containing protein n=1 Tax=Polaromonas sp. CF318 TaxID=1144318 RepID=UPI0002711F8B|nr:MBG domain-containing protein [Polaromonas sp. CF318]EJL80332.1 filamentous hemagglutinin family N-terminal domain containing protein [Polaromonas sp. CF318]
MNCIYRIVWSRVSNSWVAVAENARGRGKSTSGPRLVAAALALAGASWGMPAYAADAANATVSAGSGSVATVGNATTINQVSQRLAIDWTNLSTRANEALVFSQPNAAAIALNRITGSSPSELLGSLTANGQVFILNPNGVLFGAGSQVNVGGLVASTLSMSNADFMAGNHVFTGSGGSGSVVNQGALNAAPGGYLALLAPEVRNEGVMTASLGTALLAAGNKVTLNLDNGSLLGYSIDQGAIKALAENKQLIQANGGQVLLSAKAMDSLTTATVNNTGVIEAKTIQNKAGRILLMGDMETGTVNVGGTLDASAPTGGDGGFIETSAAHVKVADSARVTTLASAGNTGKWLIDPNDFTISAGGDMSATAVQTALSGGNFEISTFTMGTAGSGDIHVNQAINRTDSNTFTLTAERDININQNISKNAGGAAGLTLNAGRNIGFNAHVTSSSGALALTANAGGDITGGGTLNTNTGAIDMTAGGSIGDLGQINAGSLKLKATTGELIVNSGVDWRASSFDLYAGTNIRGSDPNSAANVMVFGNGNVTASAGNTGNGRIRLNASSGAIGTLSLTAQGTGGGGQIDFSSDSAVGNAMITAAQDVSVSATGNLTLNTLALTGANQNVNLAASGGTLTLGALNTGAGNLTLSGGSIALGGALSAKDLSLSATNGLNINQDLTATGNLTLAASNAAIQQTAGTLAVSGTTGVSAGAGPVSLTGANNFTGAVSVTNLGANNVAITSGSGSLTLGTLSLGSGTLNLSGGNITQTGAITQAAGAGAVTVNGGASAIDLSNTGNDFTGAVGLNNTGANAVVVKDVNNLVLGASSVGGSLAATSNTGSISQTGALSVAGASTFTLNGSSKDVLLGTSANTFTGGVTVNGSGSVRDMAFRYGSGFAFPTAPSYSGTLALINDGGSIDLGTQTFSGGLALTATGGISLLGGTLQTGGSQTFNSAVTVGGTASLASTGGAITFANTVNGANALSTTSAGATNFNASVGATQMLSGLSVTSGGAINVQSGASLRASDLKMSAAGGIGNGVGGAAAIDAARLSAVNSGSGNIALSHTGTGRVVVTDLGLGDGIQNSASGGSVSLSAANGAIQVLGSTVSAAGGNVLLSAAGYSDTHALEIVNNGATRSNITTTGAGTITLSGSLTSGGASATGGSAAGLVVTNSSITSDTGAISITGNVSGASTGSRVERGFRLDSGTQVTSAGDISLTGTLSSNQAISAYTGQNSMGGELANGAIVSSTGGDVTVSGTFHNQVHFDGTALAVGGKVQSGASKKVVLSGDTRVGVIQSGQIFTGAGTGLSTGMSSEIIAGTGGLDITGTVLSASTSTNLVGVVLAGAASSTGNITVTGTSSAISASGVRALDLQAGTLTGLGAASITLRGSGVPAPAPASSFDVGITGTTVSTAGGQINLIGDRMRIDNTVNSGSGRTVITPTTTTRQISLVGVDEANYLNLSNSELNLITASVLAIGGGTFTGGIEVGGNSAVNMANTQTLSLANSSTSGPGITQNRTLTVANLNADAKTVNLSNAGNQISQVSGRSYGGDFQVSSASALSVGTVDGMTGINAGGNAVTLNSGGALTQTQTIVGAVLQATSTGGMALNNAGNQIGALTATNNSSGDMVLRNGINTTLTSLTNTGTGRIDVDNIGTVTLASSGITSSGTATGTTAGTAAVRIKGSQGIVASGAAPHISNSAGGSVYLDGGAGNVGASPAGAVGVSATSVSAVGAGGASQVNLSLANGGTLENIFAAGGVNVTATAGSLAVKTVAGSSVSLSAAAGAITDANGAANNISGTTLNASAQNGIALGTNVTGLQTLATTGAGAAGDISVTAANALSSSNLSISTHAGSAQTVSLSSGAGITVDSAFGNAQDKFKLIATGGNIAINGALTAGELTLSTAGTSTQTAAITATGLELLGSGTHTLNNAGNAVTTLAGNTGNVDYAQAGALAIGTVNTAGLTTSGKVLVRATGATGDITLNNTVTSGSAANDSLVLAAGRNFINNAGATPLNPGAGRFLVYSTDPTANTFGGFASTGNAFSRTYAANAPTDASMTSISGNRMVYSVTPVINVTGDNQAKVYGAADPTLSYTVGSGLVAGDTAGSVLAGLLAAPTGSAASAGTHAITQGTLAAALGYGIAYTNGTLTVNKATVSVTGMAANNKTYDGSAAATLGNIGTLTGMAYGEALTLNSTGASFADANAGTGKTVTATYTLANGTGLASNYQLAAAPVTTTADIAKANLSVTANNDSRTVGAAPYAGGNGVSFSGFAGGDTAAVLGGALAYGGSSQGASAVGSYAITASGYSASNYTLNYVNGVLTINPVAVVVPVVPTAPAAPAGQGGGASSAGDAYTSALYNVAALGGSGGSGGGLGGGGLNPSDALSAAVAEAGNTGEE